jgi:Domain of unknown function (DUF4037)
MRFVPSLELSRMLYEEEIRPLMETNFPDVRYAAASLGMCSETLGLDDAVSMDHMWGPRVTLFLSEEDQARYGDELAQRFRQQLPKTFKGFPMAWLRPGVDVQDTTQEALYTVRTTTLDRALGFCGGTKALPLQDLDWLKVSEQHLLEFTAGVVYHDGPGALTQACQALAYYPDHVLRFLLSGEWSVAGSEWFPIGRIGTRGDRLGLHIQAAKVAQHLMRIAFMVSRRYWTYKKWFGTLFRQLPIAGELEPVLLELLEQGDWRQVEDRIGDAAGILLRKQNELGLTPPIALPVDTVDNGRHHIKYDFWAIGRQLTDNLSAPLQALMDNQVFWLHDRSLILWNEEVAKWPTLLQK